MFYRRLLHVLATIFLHILATFSKCLARVFCFVLQTCQPPGFPRILPGSDVNPGFPDSDLKSRVFMNYAQTQTWFEPPTWNHFAEMSRYFRHGSKFAADILIPPPIKKRSSVLELVFESFYSVLDIFYSVLDTFYSVLDNFYSVLDNFYSVVEFVISCGEFLLCFGETE